MYQTLAVYFAVFAVSFIGVKLFREWSLRRNLLDIPNERSSHSVPTPRGGGLIICAVSLLTFGVYTFLTSGLHFYMAYYAGAVIVAAISLIDDVKALSPFVRIFFHAAAAALAVWSYGGFAQVWLPFHGLTEARLWGDFLAFIWIVWLINAYNFMDGIDGIAAIQAITAGAGWALAGIFLGANDIGFYGGVLAFSALGFLMLNWQPAKIFMGDVGSAFLGYSFAVLPLLAFSQTSLADWRARLPWISVLLVWFFVFDSVVTFLQRLFRGERVWQPHREHIYQKMVISGLGHSTVALIYGACSAILVIFLVSTLIYSLNFENSVLGAAAVMTVLLVAIWQLTVRTGK